MIASEHRGKNPQKLDQVVKFNKKMERWTLQSMSSAVMLFGSLGSAHKVGSIGSRVHAEKLKSKVSIFGFSWFQHSIDCSVLPKSRLVGPMDSS